jgi:hypothetical protein
MRHLRLVIVLLAGLGTATPAAAQGWGRGWFERLSGPGPFYGTDVRLGVGCVPDAIETRFDPLWKSRTPATEPALLCFDAEFSFYANDDNDRRRHGIITFDRYQLLAMYIVPQTRLNGAVEVGAGVGSMTFRGNAFEFDRKFVPLRLVVKPFRLAADSERSRQPVFGILQIVGTFLIFPEAIRHQDFNIVPVIDEDRFSHHYHPNVTVMLDFSSFLFNR